MTFACPTLACPRSGQVRDPAAGLVTEGAGFRGSASSGGGKRGVWRGRGGAVITFGERNARFVYRVAGVALHNDRVLLHRALHNDYWSMPGGRVESLELSQETFRREMREELDIDVQVGRLLWVVENFFVDGGVHYHELGLYYLMALPPDCALYRSTGPVRGDEEGIVLIFEWHRLDGLEETTLYPAFLRRALASIPDTTEHVVHRD